MRDIEYLDVVEHAIDNGFRGTDYATHAVLDTERVFTRTQPDPCDCLPRQFGYWFHTAPGLAPLESRTYAHAVLVADKVRVLGSDGVVAYVGNWVDTASLSYARTHLATCQFRREGDRLIVPAPVRHLEGRWFLGYNAGHANYAHWLTDGLPLLVYYTENLMNQGVRLLMPRDRVGFVSQYLSLLAIPDSVIEYVGDEVVGVETLFHPTSFSFDRIPYSAVDLLRRFVSRHQPPPDRIGRKLYVSRKDTVVRSLLNEDDIVAILASKGFEVIVPGKLSVPQQINAFGSADVVVGVHGAAMANVAFCRPGTQIIELFPEYTASPHFWLLASHFELRYGAVFGTSFDSDEALTDQTRSWGAPFVIDPTAIRRLVF